MRQLIWLSSFSILIIACSSTKYTPADYPENSITFGSGGGFTGLVTEYTLLDNGQLFEKHSNETEYITLPKVSKNQASQLFDSANTLGLQEIEFNNPGNMNTFLRLKNEKGIHEITWGVPGPNPPEGAKLFYSVLLNLTKNTK